MYNLRRSRQFQLMDGIYLVPPTGKGKSGCPFKKKSEDSTNIVKSSTEEVDEGQISTVKR